jgi:hypothetical protein
MTKKRSPMSWKLNRQELIMVDAEAKVAADAASVAGKSEKEVADTMLTTWKAAAKRMKVAKLSQAERGAAADDKVVPAAANAPVNQMYLMDLEAAINTILTCPTFRNIKDADPIRITHADRTSKSHCVFNRDGCAVALGREKRYIAAGNFWWQNVLGSQTPGVPLRKSRVMDLACQLFDLKLDWKSEQPLGHLPPLKSLIVVLVDSAAQVAQRRLHRVSPDEIVHAVVFACAHEVAAGVPVDRLARWRTVFLTCSFCFELATGDGGGIDAAYMKSHSLRQLYVEAYPAALQRTAKQTAHEIFRFKRMRRNSLVYPSAGNMFGRNTRSMVPRQCRRTSSQRR